MADEPTTGEEPQTVEPTGTAAGDAGETPEQMRDRITALEKIKEEHLAMKSHAEDNARRVKELESEREVARQAPPTGAGNPVMNRLAAKVQEWNYRAANNDEDAQAMLDMLQVTGQSHQQLYQRIEELEVPEADRSKVKKYAQENGVNLTIARKLLRAESLEAKQADLEQREKDLEAQRKAREEGKMGTFSTPVPFDEAKTVMGVSEYQKRINELEAAGRDDEAAKLERAVDSGRVKLVLSK